MTLRLSEAQLHNAVADYLRVAIPESHPDALWSTIGHGGGGKVRGAQLKARGVKRGVPDIFLAWWDGHQSRVGWVELKSYKGDTSEEQDAFLEKAASLAHDTAICRSLSEVYRKLVEWQVPLRAHVTTDAV